MPDFNYKTFTIQFTDTVFAPAINIPPQGNVQAIIAQFGLSTPRPVLFLSGGASLMAQEDIDRTRLLIEDGIARFAEENSVVVLDGGTEAGIMQMLGEARQKYSYKFPLIGIAPRLKISYPSFDNPDSEAKLQSGHSHFVLVESDDWGAESQTIVDLTRGIAKDQPMMGILINGGQIAEQDIYLATSKKSASHRTIPILVLEGSGRKADELSTAFKSGHAATKIIKAIIDGGDIRITGLNEGAEAMRKHLNAHFNKGKTT